MNLDETQMKFRQNLEEKFRQNLEKIQIKSRTLSRLTHFETIQTNLDKKLGKFRRIQNTSDSRQIQTKFR